MKKSILLLLFAVQIIGFGQENGCITGDCKNGEGIYIWSNGDKYIGEFNHNQFHGKGTLISDHATYIGGWNNGKQQGLATTKYKFPDTVLTQFWNLGSPVGECLAGDCFNSLSTIFFFSSYFSVTDYDGEDSPFEESKLMTISFGDVKQTYIGELKHGKPHGKGKMISTKGKNKSEIQGLTLEGLWEEGRFLGE